MSHKAHPDPPPLAFSQLTASQEGEPPEGAADLDALTDFAGRVVQFLQEKNLAHNVPLMDWVWVDEWGVVSTSCLCAC